MYGHWSYICTSYFATTVHGRIFIADAEKLRVGRGGEEGLRGKCVEKKRLLGGHENVTRPAAT